MVLSVILSIFMRYGVLGLFVSSFLSSLVFVPGYAYFLIPIFIKLHFNPWQILVVTSIGAIFGEIVNYYIGYFGSKYIVHKEIKKAKKWLNKWGDMSVMIVNLLPIFPADVINVLVGFFKMDFKEFVVGMSIGKILQYVFFILLSIYGIEAILKLLSIYGTGGI